MRRTIAGSRALVTGASGGIGRAIALELARQGADLVLLARRAEKLAALAADIARLGRRAEVVAGDVTDPEVRQRALLRAGELGGLDLLVNNAGIGALGPFDKASPERLRRIMEVNFFALAEMIRAAIPLLVQSPRPLIVNMGSILGHRALPGAAEYCASKFAVRGLSESLRVELGGRGIDLLLVSPGSTETEFFEHLLEGESRPAWRAARPTTADKLARRVVRAMARGQREVFPSLSARLLYDLNRFTPRLVEWAVRRRRG